MKYFFVTILLVAMSYMNAAIVAVFSDGGVKTLISNAASDEIATHDWIKCPEKVELLCFNVKMEIDEKDVWKQIFDSSCPEVRVTRLWTEENNAASSQEEWVGLKEGVDSDCKDQCKDSHAVIEDGGITSIEGLSGFSPIKFFSAEVFKPKKKAENYLDLTTVIKASIDQGLAVLASGKCECKSVEFFEHTTSPCESYQKEKIPVLLSMGNAEKNIDLKLAKYEDKFEFFTKSNPPCDVLTVLIKFVLAANALP